MATLTARLREGTGKGVTRKLRATGEVPAVAYGHGEAGRALSVNRHELDLLLASINRENTIIELNVEGAQPVQALIREVQTHPSRPIIYHVDFFQVRAGEKLQVEIPIRLHGTPRGVSEGGGMLQEILRELSVECLPRNIPTSIEINIEDLDVGDSIHVSDVTLEDATILNSEDLVICTIGTQSVVSLPEDDEAAAAEDAEPEVIRERGDGGEGEAGESE